MATRLVMATSKNNEHKTMMFDVDCALDLLKEVAAVNAEFGLTMADWDFTRRNYRGEEQGPFDWKKEAVVVRLGDLFS